MKSTRGYKGAGMLFGSPEEYLKTSIYNTGPFETPGTGTFPFQALLSFVGLLKVKPLVV